MKRGLRRCSITGLFLKLFQVEVFPENITRWSAVDLEGEEAFEGGVLFVSVGEVRAKFAVEPSLQVVVFAFDDDGIPVIPLKESVPLFGEGAFVFVVFGFGGIEPTSTGFIVDTCGPATLRGFEVIVLALVAVDPAAGVFLGRLLVEGSEHAAGVPIFVEELELKGEDEVTKLILGAEEGVAFDVFSKASDRSVFYFIFSGAASFTPTSEVFAIKELCEARFGELFGIDLGGEGGG